MYRNFETRTIKQIIVRQKYEYIRLFIFNKYELNNDLNKKKVTGHRCLNHKSSTWVYVNIKILLGVQKLTQSPSVASLQTSITYSNSRKEKHQTAVMKKVKPHHGHSVAFVYILPT